MKRYIKAAIKDVLDENSSVLEKVVCDPSTRPEVLDRIARREIEDEVAAMCNFRVISNLAANPNTPSGTLDYIFSTVIPCYNPGYAYDLKVVISRNPNISKELMHKLVHDKNINVVFNVLHNSNIDVDILEYLVNNSKDFRMLEEIASLPTTPVHLLRKLARYDCYGIAAEVAKNPNTPADIIEYFATDPSADSIARGILASDPSSSPELLRKIFKTEPEYFIFSRLMKNPNTPKDLIPEMVANDVDTARDVARSKQLTPKFLHILLQSDDWAVMYNLAGNPSTPVSNLMEFANNSDYEIRQAAASNPNLPVSSMRKLAKDKTKAVRYTLVHNDAVPNEVLELLTTDKISQVRYAALRRLGRGDE